MEKVILLTSSMTGRDSDGNRISLPPQEVGFFYALCAPSVSASKDVGRSVTVEAFDVYTRDTFISVHTGDLVEIRGKQYTVSQPAQVWGRSETHHVGVVIHVERIVDQPEEGEVANG